MKTTADRLFTGRYPNAVVFADRHVPAGCDYETIAYLVHGSQEITWTRDDVAPELRKDIGASAARIIAQQTR